MHGLVLTAKDAAALALAVVLHDSAMHLPRAGVVTLIDNAPLSPSRSPRFLPPSEQRPWAQLWQEFCRDLRHKPAEWWRRVTTADVPCPLPNIDFDSSWTDHQKSLVGEFVRRHHTRLAYEFARFGVPGASGWGAVALAADLDDDVREIAGLVAWSHGTNIRAARDQITSADEDFLSGLMHAPFLMAVLRIADYVQVDSSRTPKATKRLKGVRNLVSSREWWKHEAVRSAQVSKDDPECLKVTANPSDNATYLALRALFADIQHELDSSWAVIGEVYGRTWPQLGITLRRIRSTIDDEAEFAKRVEFIPGDFKLKLSSPQILELLVKPLYGDSPAVGVRELTQNAVDAVIERDNIDPVYRETLRHDGKPDITLDWRIWRYLLAHRG